MMYLYMLISQTHFNGVLLFGSTVEFFDKIFITVRPAFKGPLNMLHTVSVPK